MALERKTPSDIAFTDAVKAIQRRKGSRSAYARMEESGGWEATITPDLAAFPPDSRARGVRGTATLLGHSTLSSTRVLRASERSSCSPAGLAGFGGDEVAQTRPIS